MIAIAKNTSNNVFYVSSVSKAVLIAAVAAFAKKTKTKSAVRIVVLGYPNLVCLVDNRGFGAFPAIGQELEAGVPSKMDYEPFKWTDAATHILRTRLQLAASFENAERALVDECGLRASLASSLVENERLQCDSEASCRRHDAKASLLVRERVKSETHAKKVEILRKALKTLALQIKTVSRDYAAFKTNMRETLDLHTGSLNLEPALIMQLVRTAVQCAHYFDHDRFSSSYFREHIVTSKDGREGIPVSVLLGFPLIVELIAGDASTLRAACAMLKGVEVASDIIWM